MDFFNFHHHSPQIHYGIYNLSPKEAPCAADFSVGLHPMDLQADWAEQWAEVQKKSLDPHCRAIGECGLDSRAAASDALQHEAFRQHILWANEIRKPVVIHCVKRFSALLPFRKLAQTALIVHGFNKKAAIAESLLSNSFYLSFGNSLLQSVSLQAVFRQMPLEKVFLETDNSEAEIAKIYEKAAHIKGITLEQLLDAIQNNLASAGIK